MLGSTRVVARGQHRDRLNSLRVAKGIFTFLLLQTLITQTSSTLAAIDNREDSTMLVPSQMQLVPMTSAVAFSEETQAGQREANLFT